MLSSQLIILNYTVQISFMGAIIIVEIVHRKPLPDTYNLELVTLYLYMLVTKVILFKMRQ